MAVVLFPTIGGDPFLPAATLDIGTSETQEDTVTWSQVPVEGTGSVAEHGVNEPTTWTFTGKVGAADPNNVLPRDLERINRQHDRLLVLKKARQLVTVVGASFVASAGISRVVATRDQSTGDVISIDLGLQEISLPIPTTTTIPASRLRASVRRRGAPGKPGGAGPAKRVDLVGDSKAIDKANLSKGGGHSAVQDQGQAFTQIE